MNPKALKNLIFVIIFFLAAPLVVLYANGDIFSNGWNLSSTGGIYVRNAPIGAEIFLNNKLKDKVNFFQRDILIKNLNQGSYEVTVKKDGYNSWTKKIKVTNNLVSDANTFMLPTKIELRNIDKYTQNGADSTTTLAEKIENIEYDDVLSIFNSKNKAVNKNGRSTSTIDFKNGLGTAQSPVMNGKLGIWKDGGKIFVKWFGSNDTAPKYLCSKDDLTDCQQTKMVFELPKEPVRIGFLPDYDGAIIISTEGMIFAVQIEENPEKMIQLLYKGKNPDFRLTDGYIYAKDGSSLYEILL